MKQMITIQEARKSQSGKSLGISDGQRWYITKCWDLEQMVGQAIYADISQSEYNGKPQYWINDYQAPGGDAMQPGGGHIPPQKPIARIEAAVAAVDRPPAPTPAAVNRDASIVAQTLCKTITFHSVEDAWLAYQTLYAHYILWSQKVGKQAAPDPAEQQMRAVEDEWDGKSDDIPF